MNSTTFIPSDNNNNINRPHPHRRLCIIGMSANSDEDTKQCALNAGMDTFLAKPFAMAELLPVLYSVSDRFRSGSEDFQN